ncbi:helix-turn-helix domain-containing protein [Salmonella enterica subsp. enterica serovar Saintpaul]|nr:helix-turn-helix domain-containing protein [Salmonella enterica subsp. enterica serovar Typhimurium]EEI9159997.1 helix-turn-helix domain-containing protein [Salmonella enterica subsp. enterica serovar Saintpaul]EFK1462469.1 helix-turn-helix domain-containing protein [Escherichia coli]EGW7995870.1 helix-turn-helix domain-containing protein [Salmonella enterica]MJF13723.1 AraC family transcriptional regulator [Salmonella enterica subsp. enterica]
MDAVCSVVLVCQPFDLIICKKPVSFRKNTVLLLEPAARSKLSDCPSLVRTVELDHKTVLSFLNDVNNRLPDMFCIDRQGYVIEENIPLSLVYSLFEGIRIADAYTTSLREKLCLSLLSVFQERTKVISFLLTYMNTFSYKIMGIIGGDLERAWHLKDIAARLYASESLIKKRLKEEGSSFSEILRELRMESARKMILENTHSVSMVAQKCGYNSTSYFISAFKDYYGMTPLHYYDNAVSEMAENKQKAPLWLTGR